ncbi:MAG: repeat protein, partial [Acidobacteria bacterium]|nr:repeat protein [Acidobacteriota bacterium]
MTAPGGGTWRTYDYGPWGMTAVHDALGNLIESHTFDSAGRGITSTGPSDEISSIQYGLTAATPDDSLTRVTLRTGAVVDYVQRAVGGAWRTVHVIGGCTSCGARDSIYAMDTEGHISREQAANGYVTETFYAGDLVSSVRRPLRPSGCDPETSNTRCRLDENTLATAALDPTSATSTTTYTYGDANWPEKPTEISRTSVLLSGQLSREQFTYDAATGAVLIHRQLGWAGATPQQLTFTTTTALYNGTEAAVFTPGGTFNSSWLTLAQPTGLRKSVDGPRTDVSDLSRFVYYPIDAAVPARLRGRLAAVQNAAGQIVRYESYDEFGNVLRTVDANGVAYETTVDGLGRPLTSTIKGVPGCDTAADALCATDLTTTRLYDPAAGPLQRITQPDGNVTVYEYDARGRTSAMMRGPSATDLRERMETTYDLATGKKDLERYLARQSGSWVEKRRDTYQYDTLAQLSAVTHADQTSIGYSYDVDGMLLGVRDENHAAANTQNAYDPARRLAAVTQTLAGAPGGQVVTRYAYDVQGNLVSVTDPNGNVTSYSYDDFHRMQQQVSPVTGMTTYAYDAAGNLTSTTDANGAATARTYDPLNRVLTATSTRAGAATETVTWTYDDASSGSYGRGRLASIADPAGQTLYRYERRGLLRSEQRTTSGATYTTTFGYAGNGSRSSITYPTGRVVSYSFDYADRPLGATSAGSSLVSSAEYLPFGPMTSLVYGNGTTKIMQYDARYRPLGNKLVGPAGTIADYTYAEDAAGNITQLHDAVDATWNRDFGYDDLNRLVTANAGTSLWGTGSYTYDAMGNMTALHLGAQRQSTFAYSGTTSKLATATENGVARNVTYDAAGNETAVGAAQMDIGARNLVLGSGTTQYEYDGRGVRAATSMPPFTFSFASSHVTATQAVQGTITLADAAPAGGFVLTLSAASPISVPSTVTVPAGSSSAVFTAQAADVLTATTVTVSATGGGTTAQQQLIVDRVPWALTSLTIDPDSLCPDAPDATGTVVLAAAAPAGGARVVLSATSVKGTCPDHVDVVSGQTSATFPVGMPAVECPSPTLNCTQSVTITGQLGAVQSDSYVANSLQCDAVLFVIALPEGPMRSGRDAFGSITLHVPAGASGADVALHTSGDSPVRFPRQ